MAPRRRRDRITPEDVVLGSLDDGDRAEAARRQLEDPAFRAEVERLREVAAALADLPERSADPGPPPALDLAAALDARPGRPSPGLRRHRPRRTAGPRGARRPLLAAGSVVLLFGGGLLAGLAVAGDDARDAPTVASTRTVPAPAPSGRTVQLAAFRGEGPQRAAVLMPARTGGEMELRVRDARPSAAGRYYELWLLDARRTTPIGTFRVGADGTAVVRFPLAVDPSSYRYLDVSVEDDDGDPGHSGRSVLRSSALS